MKKMVLVLAITLLIFAMGCKTAPEPIGGEKDEHGCLPAAGYQWCPSTQKCQRMWEQYCEEFKDQFKNELVQSFEDCVDAGFPLMESHPRQCQRADGKTFTEDIDAN